MVDSAVTQLRRTAPATGIVFRRIATDGRTSATCLRMNALFFVSVQLCPT